MDQASGTLLRQQEPEPHGRGSCPGVGVLTHKINYDFVESCNAPARPFVRVAPPIHPGQDPTPLDFFVLSPGRFTRGRLFLFQRNGEGSRPECLESESKADP